MVEAAVQWITVVGAAEPPGPLLNPARAAASHVRASLALHGRTPAALLDITGRKVVDLVPGPNDIRHISPGVYFIGEGPRGRGSEGSTVRKVLVTK